MHSCRRFPLQDSLWFVVVFPDKLLNGLLKLFHVVVPMQLELFLQGLEPTLDLAVAFGVVGPCPPVLYAVGLAESLKQLGEKLFAVVR